MKEKVKTLYDSILKEEEVFINFLRSRFPFFYKSNFFFRDLEYGIKLFFKKKNLVVPAGENIELADEIGKHFEEKNYFKKIGDGVWMINMPQYVTEKPGDPF